MKLFLFVLALVTSWPGSADNSRTLPPEANEPEKSGLIRVWGLASLSEITNRWKTGYQALHPEIRIELHMTGSDTGMAGLYTGKADLALLGRPATPSEMQAFEWVYQYKPGNTQVLTGSFAQPGRAAALAVLVNEANPIEAISLPQLDAAFSHERRLGGTMELETWDQLGLNGEWQGESIHLYSLDVDAGSGRYFREVALGGSRALFWERLEEFGSGLERGAVPAAIANRALLQKLSHDPFGLAVGVADASVSGVKTLALASCDNCEAVPISVESVASGRYPLVRTVSAYFHQPLDGPVDAVLADFLHYVLNAGQGLLLQSDGYLPITSESP